MHIIIKHLSIFLFSSVSFVIKVAGLYLMADDNITKPFELDILESRIVYPTNLPQKFIREYQMSLKVK